MESSPVPGVRGLRVPVMQKHWATGGHRGPTGLAWAEGSSDFALLQKSGRAP